MKPVKVRRGDRVTLTTDALLATDGSDRPEELLYVVTGPPSHGHIEYVAHPGVAVSTFSQLDVAANQVAYTHDNRGGSPSDHFQCVWFYRLPVDLLCPQAASSLLSPQVRR